MTTGLQVLNDKNSVQIGSDYQNFVLTSKTYKTGRNPIVFDGLFYAIQPTTNSVPDRFGNYNVSDSCTYFRTADGSLGNMTVYGFGLPTPSLGNGVGLQVFKEDGSVAFDSNLKYMKVLATRSSSMDKATAIRGLPFYDGDFEFNGYKFNLNFGHRNVAVIFSSTYKVRQFDYMPEYWVSSCHINANNDLLIYDFQNESNAFFNPSGYVSSSCNWLVIDTTGL